MSLWYHKSDACRYIADNGGNICSVKTYAYTTGELGTAISEKVYTYGNTKWKDLLTNYNGVDIAYDTIGNPLNWINGETFTWGGGRQLTGIAKGDNTISYTYNDNGIRTSKTVNGVRTDYYLNGTAIIMQKTGDNVIWYTYDENGLKTGFTYNDTAYYYVYNLQGDVIALLNSAGETVARYDYDPWGKIIAITDGNGVDVSSNAAHIANINPTRYRGYYYDTETGLYYLQSRYYDAEVGRFINADGYISTGQGTVGSNMFAYCGNNPVNRTDNTGHFWSEIADVIRVVVAEVGKALGAISPVYEGCGELAISDGPLPIGDAIAAVGAIVVTVGAIGYGVYQAAQSISISASKARSDTEDKDIAIPSSPPKQAIFTPNPYDFNPRGLIRTEYAGSGNGRIIKWVEPGTKTPIFEWDEDYEYGAHYHAMLAEWKGAHNKMHYAPGSIVPEPWNSTYF